MGWDVGPSRLDFEGSGEKVNQKIDDVKNMVLNDIDGIRKLLTENQANRQRGNSTSQYSMSPWRLSQCSQ